MIEGFVINLVVVAVVVGLLWVGARMIEWRCFR